MHGRDVSVGVRELVERHINSLGRLDLLLVLYQDPKVAWTAELMAKQTHASESWVRAELEALTEAGITRKGDTAAASWCYDPATDETAVAVRELVNACRFDWSATTKLVRDQQPSGAQAFSNAFRLRKKGDG